MLLPQGRLSENRRKAAAKGFTLCNPTRGIESLWTPAGAFGPAPSASRAQKGRARDAALGEKRRRPAKRGCGQAGGIFRMDRFCPRRRKPLTMWLFWGHCKGIEKAGRALKRPPKQGEGQRFALLPSARLWQQSWFGTNQNILPDPQQFPLYTILLTSSLLEHPCSHKKACAGRPF